VFYVVVKHNCNVRNGLETLRNGIQLKVSSLLYITESFNRQFSASLVWKNTRK